MSEEFKAGVEGSVFVIRIDQESNWSQDGGYTFENVENAYELSNEECEILLDKLEAFLGKQKTI